LPAPKNDDFRKKIVVSFWLFLLFSVFFKLSFPKK